MRVGAATLSIAVCLVGCIGGRYSGDGQLLDNGWSTATGRYVLDLGPLNLDTSSTIVRRLAGLPPKVSFTVGVSVVGAALNVAGRLPPAPTAIVRLTMVRSDGATIIAEEAPLNEWVRAYSEGEQASFLYRRGRVREVPQRGGVLTYTLVDVRPDGGWGSYFTSAAGAEYKLVLEVLSPQAPSGLTYRLVAIGGGWK